MDTHALVLWSPRITGLPAPFILIRLCHKIQKKKKKYPRRRILSKDFGTHYFTANGKPSKYIPPYGRKGRREDEQETLKGVDDGQYRVPT